MKKQFVINYSDIKKRAFIDNLIKNNIKWYLFALEKLICM